MDVKPVRQWMSDNYKWLSDHKRQYLNSTYFLVVLPDGLDPLMYNYYSDKLDKFITALGIEFIDWHRDKKEIWFTSPQDAIIFKLSLP